MVRQPNFNYKICDEFAKDNRFELYYHGAGYHEEIKLYCNNKNLVITVDTDGFVQMHADILPLWLHHTAIPAMRHSCRRR